MKKFLIALVSCAVVLFVAVMAKMWNDRDNIRRWNLWYDEHTKAK